MLVLIEIFHSSGELLVLRLNKQRKICNARHFIPFDPQLLKSLKKYNQNLKVFVL